MQMISIKDFATFCHYLEQGEIIIAQDGFDLEDVDRMYWFKRDNEIQMVTNVESGLFKADYSRVATIYEDIEDAFLFVIPGAKIEFVEGN